MTTDEERIGTVAGVHPVSLWITDGDVRSCIEAVREVSEGEVAHYLSSRVEWTPDRSDPDDHGFDLARVDLDRAGWAALRDLCQRVIERMDGEEPR